MIDQDLLIKSVTDATTEVFQMMLGMEVECVGPAPADAEPEKGLIALIGITGDWAGAGVFCCSPTLAGIVCARMLGTEVNANSSFVDEEVMDVVAEVTNMVVGNIKNGLESATGPLAISVPTVIHGRNFHFRSTSGQEYANLIFTTEGETFNIRISLAPSLEQNMVHSRIPILGMAHS